MSDNGLGDILPAFKRGAAERLTTVPCRGGGRGGIQDRDFRQISVQASLETKVSDSAVLSKKTQLSFFSNVFAVPPQLHGAWLALLGITATIIRFRPVAKILEAFLFAVPIGKDNPGVFTPGGTFKPLGPFCWALHLLMYSLSLEIAYGFFSIMQRSIEPTTKRNCHCFFAIYAVGCLQSLLNLLSHSMVNLNLNLEAGLLRWDQALLQTNIFGAGLAVTVGVWTMIPVFLGIVLNKINFGNWPGRLLATYSLFVHYSKKEVPQLFLLAYIALPLLLAFSPWNVGMSDANHAIVSVVLSLLFGAMSMSLNRRLKVQ